MSEDSVICKNCGKKEHCRWALKDNWHCDNWQVKELKLVEKDGMNWEFEEI